MTETMKPQVKNHALSFEALQDPQTAHDRPATVRRVHAALVWCGFRAGSAGDGQGIPVSFSARAVRMTRQALDELEPIQFAVPEVSGGDAADHWQQASSCPPGALLRGHWRWP
jgi:hypothetical protein